MTLPSLNLLLQLMICVRGDPPHIQHLIANGHHAAPATTPITLPAPRLAQVPDRGI